MADEKEKKPGLWDRFKKIAKHDVGADVKKPFQAADAVAKEYTPTFRAGAGWLARTVPGAVAGGAMAVGRAGVGFFRLVGKFTFLFVLLAGILHIAYINSGMVSLFGPYLVAYTLLGILAAVFFYADPQDPFPLKRILKFVLLAWAAYLFPLLINQANVYLSMPREFCAVLMTITPLLVIYAFLDPGDAITKFLGGVYWVGLSAWLIIGVLLPMMAINGPQYNDILLSPGEMQSAFMHAFTKTASTVSDSTTAVIKSGTDAITGKTKNVTQEIYAGQVDSTQGIPLGIQLIEAQSLLQKFHLDQTSGDDVIATATVRARTINENAYTVINNCSLVLTNSYAGTDKIIVNGTVNPGTFDIGYTGDQYDQRLIECRITSDNIKAATAGKPFVNTVSGDVVFNTTFNFTTSGYMTYGFMQKDLFAALRVDNKDPAREMGLPSNRQQAKYTPGPVMLGMPADSTPYPIDVNDKNAVDGKITIPSFGITFGNAFQGRGGIQSFGTTYVYVPKQLTILSNPDTKDKPNPCTPKSISLSDTPADDANMYGTDYQRYTFVNLVRNMDSPYTTVRCPMQATAKDLLGPSGAGIYTLFVVTNYTYATDTSVPVTLYFPAKTDTTGAGLTVNTQTGDTKAACKTLSPYCTGTPDDGSGQCYCFYKSTDRIGACSYAWDAKGKLVNAPGAVDGTGQGTCHDSGSSDGVSKGILLTCAGKISCTDTTCTCIAPKADGSGSTKCTWPLTDWINSVKCADYVRGAVTS